MTWRLLALALGALGDDEEALRLTLLQVSLTPQRGPRLEGNT